ncbi:MAG: hypothetical protein ACKOX6_05950 [Bdellovibrio sp.]
MKKQWKRLLIAALSSSSVFAFTWYWYQSTSSLQNAHSNEKPLAYVGKVVDDIQRRPASRLLWQLVNTGEPLYNGEAIRTSERGEVRIQFTDSDRYLDLEPESLIVIKKSEGEIALDLMEGSLFVNAKADESTTAPGLVLNSTNGKVDLSHASASLSKGSGNSLDVQVLEGKASLRSKDGQSKELTKGNFGALGAKGVQFDSSNLKILSPTPQKPFAMNVDDPQPVPFKWTGFPDNSTVSLHMGNTRKDMKEVTSASPGHSDLSFKMPFGRHFWKLVAKNPEGQVVAESPTYKTEVVARYAPTVVFPTADAEIPANTSPFDMSFKWEKGDDTRQVTLEVWSDSELKNKVATKTFSTEDSFTLPGLKDGPYFWRMSSLFTDSDRALVGKLQKFTIKPASQVSTQPKVNVPINVNFTMPESQYTQYYVEKPQVGFNWNADKTENVSAWRVRVHEENEDVALATPVEVKDMKLSAPVAKPGRYIASIEAVNKDGEVIGTSISQPVTISPLPILKAPTFIPDQGALQASLDGRIELQWNKIDGAKVYQLVIKKNGKELKRTNYPNTSTALRNLLPGEYEVDISAVDAYGRLSEVSPSRKLIVQDKSDVKAPTLKKIKVN